MVKITIYKRYVLVYHCKKHIMLSYVIHVYHYKTYIMLVGEVLFFKAVLISMKVGVTHLVICLKFNGVLKCMIGPYSNERCNARASSQKVGNLNILLSFLLYYLFFLPSCTTIVITMLFSNNVIFQESTYYHLLLAIPSTCLPFHKILIILARVARVLCIAMF